MSAEQMAIMGFEVEYQRSKNSLHCSIRQNDDIMESEGSCEFEVVDPITLSVRNPMILEFIWDCFMDSMELPNEIRTYRRDVSYTSNNEIRGSDEEKEYFDCDCIFDDDCNDDDDLDDEESSQ